jgi:glucan endo-1,3-beta-D-glucosidase
MKLIYTLLLTPCLVHAADKVHTGFNYGAFWKDGRAKTKADFTRLFNQAKNIKNNLVTFDSARLFTNVQQGTMDEPIAAFEAAIDTGTTLLLGIWWTVNISHELKALDTALGLHKNKLADLVIGISIGNEDVHRGDASIATIGGTVEKVRGHINNPTDYANLAMLKDKPIGYVDVLDKTLNDGVDFIGLNAYLYWAGNNIAQAKNDYLATIAKAKEKANEKPLWLTELGWPFAGAASGQAEANVQNQEKFWNDVGCSLFGKHNLWWFELEPDSGPAEKTDWGIFPEGGGEIRFDASCSKMSNYPNAADDGGHAQSSASAIIDRSPSTASSAASSTAVSTVSVTNAPITIPIVPSGSSSSSPSIEYITAVECVTVYDAGNGQMPALTTNIVTNGPCPSPK